MKWLDFEHEVRALVEAFGYAAVVTPPSGDLGADVIAESAKRKVVIQCKLYGKSNIGSDAIIKLIGSRTFFDATDAICFTTSGFTKSAIFVAKEKNVVLVDRKMLLALCRQKQITIPSLTWLIANECEDIKTSISTVWIGRSTENQVILADPRISKHHAKLVRHGLMLEIIDNNSTNGTFVNNQKILEKTKLTYGDRIRICEYTFRVGMVTPVGAFFA